MSRNASLTGTNVSRRRQFLGKQVFLSQNIVGSERNDEGAFAKSVRSERKRRTTFLRIFS